MKSLGWNASSGAYSRDYNSLGQLTEEIKGGGSVSYAYDGIGRLASFTNNLSGTTSDIAWTFGYNPAGQIVSNDPSSTLYDYEELTPVTEPAQSHDGLNRISTLVLPTGACPSGGYDARGNLICDGTGRSYNYDVENRLLTGNIAGNGLTLTYDPEGRLASYSWNGGAVSFLYDGVNLVGEYNSSNQMLRRYVHGPGTDNPVAWYEGAGNSTLRYFYTNQQGSVITTSDASGNRGDIYAYGAYGEPKDQAGFTYWPSIGTGSTSVSRFGYTGQMFLADARLYYYKARIYDPQMGRFLQTDPIGSEDDLNLYAYVGGDPINRADPTGLVGCAVGCPFGEGIGIADPNASRERSITVEVPMWAAGPAVVAADVWKKGVATANVVGATAAAAADALKRREKAYSVTVQIQGKALTTKGLPQNDGSKTASTPLAGTTPIPASEARAALYATVGQLNKGDQKLLMSSGAFNNALSKLGKVEAAGGFYGTGNVRGTGTLSTNDLRIDFQVNSGDRNLVPE